MSYHPTPSPTGACCAACAKKPPALGLTIADAIAANVQSTGPRTAAPQTTASDANTGATGTPGASSRWPIVAAAGIAVVGIGAFLYLRKKR